VESFTGWRIASGRGERLSELVDVLIVGCNVMHCHSRSREIRCRQCLI
jgi:hypothetical protein